MNQINITRYAALLEQETKELSRYAGMLLLLRHVFVGTYRGASKKLEDAFVDTLNTLSDREREVLVLRYGMGTSPPMTLGETARMFGVSRERIRQIEARALRKLRHPSRRFALMGMSWQMAVQESRSMGVKLLAKHAIEHTKIPEKDTVDDLKLPMRIIHALRRSGYFTVESIARASDDELLRVRNIGFGSIPKIRAVVPKKESVT